MNRTLLVLACLAASLSSADEPKLLRSQSGPGGVVSGATFLFDETRNRFVFPNDKSLTAYFEWKSTPGLHVLSAFWKQHRP